MSSDMWWRQPRSSTGLPSHFFSLMQAPLTQPVLAASVSIQVLRMMSLTSQSTTTFLSASNMISPVALLSPSSSTSMATSSSLPSSQCGGPVIRMAWDSKDLPRESVRSFPSQWSSPCLGLVSLKCSLDTLAVSSLLMFLEVSRLDLLMTKLLRSVVSPSTLPVLRTALTRLTAALLVILRRSRVAQTKGSLKGAFGRSTFTTSGLFLLLPVAASVKSGSSSESFSFPVSSSLFIPSFLCSSF